MEDKEKDKQEKVSEKSVFNVSVIYRLDGDDLIVEVPFDDLEYKEDYPIYYLSVLPYLERPEQQMKVSYLCPKAVAH